MSQDREFERWLDDELRCVVGLAQGPSPRAAQAAYRALGRRALVTVPGRLVAAMAAAALSVIAGGALAAIAYTGSPNPATWGDAVVRAVSGCKEELNAEGHRVQVPETCGGGRRWTDDPPATPSMRSLPSPHATPEGPVSVHDTGDDPQETATVGGGQKEDASRPPDASQDPSQGQDEGQRQDQDQDWGGGGAHKSGGGSTPPGEQADPAPTRRPHDPSARGRTPPRT